MITVIHLLVYFILHLFSWSDFFSRVEKSSNFNNSTYVPALLDTSWKLSDSESKDFEKPQDRISFFYRIPASQCVIWLVLVKPLVASEKQSSFVMKT